MFFDNFSGPIRLSFTSFFTLSLIKSSLQNLFQKVTFFSQSPAYGLSAKGGIDQKTHFVFEKISEKTRCFSCFSRNQQEKTSPCKSLFVCDGEDRRQGVAVETVRRLGEIASCLGKSKWFFLLFVLFCFLIRIRINYLLVQKRKTEEV